MARLRYFPCFPSRVALLLCFPAFLFLTASPASSQTRNLPPDAAPAPATGSIAGRVVRVDTGEPIGKAVVSLHPQDEQTLKAAGGDRSIRTRPDGTFVFSMLPPGAYALDVWRNGFADYSCQKNGDCRPFSLGAGQKIDNLVLRLTAAGVIAGSVMDEDQDPASGVEVYLIRVDFLKGGRREIGAANRAVTDDQGNFRMAGVLPGTYYVRAGGQIQRPMKEVGLKQGPEGGAQFRDTWFPGTPLLDEAQAIEIRPGTTRNDIRIPVTIETTHTIAGRVIGSAKGSAAQPSEVEYERQTGAAQMWGPAGATINPDGSYRTPPLPPGQYTLTATADRGGRQVIFGYSSVEIVDRDVTADLQLGAAAEVRGKIDAAPPGVPLASLQLALESFSKIYFPSDVDANGNFDIRQVPPGNYTFALWPRREGTRPVYLARVLCSGTDYASRKLGLTLNQALDCRITLADDAGTVSGQVLEGEKPAPDLVVVLIPESRSLRQIPAYTLSQNTGADGRFRLSGAIPGRYLLFAVPPDEDQSYFALDFADRALGSAEHISIDGPGEQTVILKPTRFQ